MDQLQCIGECKGLAFDSAHLLEQIESFDAPVVFELVRVNQQ